MLEKLEKSEKMYEAHAYDEKNILKKSQKRAECQNDA